MARTSASSAAERRADELGLDVDDPVGEARIGARSAVVELVGMKDVHLAGKADVPAAAVAEDLDASGGDPDRVGVVAVRGEPAAAELDLGALDARRAGAEPDPIARSF